MRTISIMSDKPIITVRFNWAWILAFAQFWTYALYGEVALPSFSLPMHLVASFFLWIIFIAFLVIAMRRYSEYEDSFQVYWRDVLVFGSYLLVLGIFSLSDLFKPLWGDPTSHSLAAIVHDRVLVEKVISKIGLFEQIPYRSVIYVINIVGIVIAILVWLFLYKYAYLKKKYSLIIVLLSLLFLGLRCVVAIMAVQKGTYHAHPSFRLFPLWISSSLFSVSNFAFQFPGFIALISGMWLLQRKLAKQISFVSSWAFGLAVASIPLLWHVGTVCEPSIGTAVIWTLLVVSLYDYSPKQPYPWVRWVSVLAIVALMRQSAVAGFIPLFLLGILVIFRKKAFPVKKLAFILLPVFIFLPFFVKSILVGTPSTNFTTQEGAIKTVFNQILGRVLSGEVLRVIVEDLSLLWALLLTLGLILFVRKKAMNLLLLWIFFVGAGFMFIATRTFGAPRYQAEYAVPFAILGLYRITIYLHKFRRLRVVLPIVIFSLFLFNTYKYFNIYNTEISFNNPFRPAPIVSTLVYNYPDAFDYIKKKGFIGSTAIIGEVAYYGPYHEIVSGYTIDETQRSAETFAQFEALRREGRLTPQQIEIGNSNIKVVLVEDNKIKFAEELKTLGWKMDSRFLDHRHQSVIYALVRK